ncbi:unnamed protein product [Schistosoma margrebowiei]|uniref:Uncharacterized protein n=1 Tax=Schistosoma margrebowiei TaxID=48269 RepID=A0A183LGM3_9TREM|nr:unnamed protein product [Schistosoma margrebowiei]
MWSTERTVQIPEEMKRYLVGVLGLSEEKRPVSERVGAQAEYTEANKRVKWSIRASKRKYVEELATKAE